MTREEELAASALEEAKVIPVEPVVVPEVVVEDLEAFSKNNIAALLDEVPGDQSIDSEGNISILPVVVSNNVPTFTPSKMWSQLKERISTEESPWEIPEHIVKGEFGEGKTEFDSYLEYIYQNTDFESVAPVSNDPFVLAYNEARTAENFDIKEWIKTQAGEATIHDLKGKEFMEAYYTRYKSVSAENPDGYTKEDIDIYVATKNRIEIDRENEVLKKDLAMRTQDQDKANIKIIKDREIEQFNKQEGKNQLAVSTFIKANEFTKDFYGIEFSEADKAQFFKDLPGLLKRDPVTKMSTIDSLMQSESDILSMAALLWKGKDGIRGHVSGIKETVKKDIEAKLGVNGKGEKGTIVTYKGVNNDALV